MDANELNQASGELLARAMNEGVCAGKMDSFQVIGILEQRKAEAAAKEQAKRDGLRIVAPGWNGGPRT
jgi:hypothetical protein